MDGFLKDWEGIPGIVLSPELEGLRSGGEFKENDVRLAARALWDDEYLYLAFDWTDDTWDIKSISRRDAVWIDPDKRRRDRMFFYDNLKVHIRKSDYDYTLWTTPRINDEGPFFWFRLLEGYKGMERATSAPMLSVRQDGSSATLEVMLIWKQLKLKPKEGETFPLSLILSDSDFPERILEFKAQHLKWLSWIGEMKLGK